jgi:prephenate dehydrogenase
MSEGADFGTVVIVGVGLLGGSIGKALLRLRPGQRVIGVGRSADSLQEALHLGAITEWTLSLDDAVSAGHVVILCTPVGQIIDDLPAVLKFAGADVVITDVGSVKAAICGAAHGDPRFVGGHPMAGSEQAGVVASRPNLFQEATWAITPTGTTNGEAVQIVKRLAQCLGAATLMLTPERHDQAVAITSHLPHALATSLMRLADTRSNNSPEIPSLTAGSFTDATRVAASSPEIWGDIFRYNRKTLIEVLTAYRAEIDGFIEELEAEEFDKLYARFASGTEAKRSWSEQR